MSSVIFTRVVGIAIVLSVTATAIVTAAPADVAMIKSRQEKLRDMGSALKQIDDASEKVAALDWKVQDIVIVPSDRLPDEADAAR